MNLKERTYLWYLSVLRIYVGFYLLQQGIRKFQRDFPKGDWIGRQIGVFGYLVMVGEISVGACLLLGILTRFAAAIGLFMLINYYLGPGMARGGAPLAQQQTFIVALAIFVLANPGRTLGLDGLLFGAGRGKGA